VSAAVDRTQGTGPGLAGFSTERAEELLGLIPHLVVAVTEIKQLLCSRQKDYYTVDEFAEIVRRAPYTIRSWVKDGRINATRVSGTGPRGRLLIPRAEIEKVTHAGLGGQIPPGMTT
jgi:excisionase family DNA binding protein